MKIRTLLFLTALSFLVLGPGDGLGAQDAGSIARRVIIFVWDGLRADDVTPENMPNYFALARSGVVFTDHHAVYPTFTMMNSASIATGAYPGVHGFYGNVVYAPSAKGKNAKGADIEFSAPAFIEDYKRGGIILDEDAAMPLGFANELQQAGYPLPRNSVNAYQVGALTLAKDNGDPTAPIPIARLKDGQTGDPLDRSGALSRRGFAYLTDVFVNYVLPNKKPDLTIFWSKEPDATSHAYGPGTFNSIDATRMNDEILGRIVEKLRQLSWEDSTDIIITQDHNHSTVSGDVAHYPLRAIVDREVGPHDPHGYSVSGFVRTAELLTRDGLKAFDGAGCRNVPTLSGTLFDGTHLHPTKNDVDGTVCGKAQTYTSPRYAVPKPVPAGGIVVAANAGSDYLFVPDGDANRIKAAVVSLQSRLQFGAVFVSDKYGDIAGTLRMGLINAESPASGRGPDIIVSFSFDENVAVAGRPGISYASSVNRRGDHGSFSRTDTHISMMAYGPDFKSGMYDTLPTANVDIAPTVARILALSMPGRQGRALEEALKDGPRVTEYAILGKIYQSSKKGGLKMKLPADLDGRSIDPNLTTYSVELTTKILTRGSPSYMYFDQARAIRE